MSNTTGFQQRTATQPIINVIDPATAESISWDVKEDLPDFQQDHQTPEETKEDVDTREDTSEQDENENDDAQDEGAEEQEVVKKKSLRAPKDKRFADFTRKIRQRDEIIQEALARNEYLEKQLSIKAQEKLSSEENLLKTHIENIEKAHAEAMEDGDYDKAAKAAALQAQYAARHETIVQQKHHMANAPAKQSSYKPQPQAVPEFNEEFQSNGEEWLKTNPWADAKSANYDQEMLEVAEDHVNTLMKRYKFEGRADEIGRPEFFNEITQHVRESFGISAPSKPQKEKLVMNSKSSSNVAPVNRTGTMSTTARSNQEIVLTPEQIQMAHSMTGMKLNGVRVTDRKQLENLYRDQLKQQMRRG